ncbi:hypothetical protein NBRC116188_29050 [Oceaniserpentilla sp. 4NH20-0058]|uniref:hypothetical protein n=1 Tax=Oceaniserpentilla sp. 4NH20-0058 TaxID=3127660 RepID=UPI0031048428
MAQPIKGHNFLSNTDRYHIKEAKVFCIPNNAFYFPCFWVAAAIYATDNKIPYQQLDIHPDIEGYASVIGFSQVLGDTTPVNRPKDGSDYSSMEKLEDDQSADAGKSRIGNCLREMLNTNKLKNSDPVKIAINDLIGVIGELHDNVVSHSKGIGFSVAQSHPFYKYKQGRFLSFAIADNGIGFLSELKARKVADINTDQEAIAWCIVKNNTSKRKSVDDEWAQRVPSDAHVNPFGPHITTKDKDNNHQGLGLDKLCQLVTKYKGELRIESGRAALYVDNTGEHRYSEIDHGQDGVSISLLLNVDEFENQVPEQPSKKVKELMNKLRRRS